MDANIISSNMKIGTGQKAQALQLLLLLLMMMMM
jgi:hypothetical protein